VTAESARPWIAVLGCGHWGKNLVRTFHTAGHLALVCDPSTEARAQAAELAPGVAAVEDPDEAIASDVDAVVIATPAETHASLARAALLDGKDVFVEKPMALRYEEAAETARLAAEHGRILMVGHVLEYHPAIVKIREMVAAGEIGKLLYVYSNRLNLGKVRREENILWSFAPHDIAVIMRLIGEVPFQVVSCGGAYVQANIADITVTHLLFDNGVRAHISVSWLHPFKEQRLVIVGTKGMISFDDVHKKLILYDRRVELRESGPVPIPGTGREVDFPRDEPLLAETRAFLEALQTRRPPLTDAASGLRTLRVLQAAQRSLITNGQPVMVETV
jgi:predicted dehydrogenase